MWGDYYNINSHYISCLNPCQHYNQELLCEFVSFYVVRSFHSLLLQNVCKSLCLFTQDNIFLIFFFLQSFWHSINQISTTVVLSFGTSVAISKIFKKKKLIDSPEHTLNFI